MKTESRIEKLEIVHGSGNLFRDLGVERGRGAETGVCAIRTRFFKRATRFLTCSEAEWRYAGPKHRVGDARS